MAAILAGMVEGVIVVDPQGRLQLANDAARQMLRLDDLAKMCVRELRVGHNPAPAELTVQIGDDGEPHLRAMECENCGALVYNKPVQCPKCFTAGPFIFSGSA